MKHHSSQKGAAAVEFAFALLALMLFFAIYMQLIEIFLFHGRLSFAGFTSARTHAVSEHPTDREIPARQACLAIEPAAQIFFESRSLMLRRSKTIPMKLSEIISDGSGVFVIEHRSPFFDEIQLKQQLMGDN